MNAAVGNKKVFGNTPAKTNTSSTSAPKTSAFANFLFMKFCPPAKAYLVIALFSLLYFVSVEQALVWIVIKAIIFIGWAFLLNKLCSSGHKAIAWLLAIVPQFIYLLTSVKSFSSSSTAPAPIAMPTTI
jgi:hypothetical protein